MNVGSHEKVALVTGASSGIGRASSLAFAQEGYKLVLADVDVDGGEETMQMILNAGGEAIFVRTDVSQTSDIKNMIEQAVMHYGRLDCAHNNAGIAGGSYKTWEYPVEEFRRVIDVDLNAVFLCCRAVVPHMRERGWGRILLVASSGVKQPIPHLGISNTLRAALLAWAKTLSMEVAADGVTVNAILPGRIRTERTLSLDKAVAERTGCTHEEVLAESLKAIPAGRQGETTEFGATAAFLASDQASYITGSAIPVDGGSIRQM